MQLGKGREHDLKQGYRFARTAPWTGKTVASRIFKEEAHCPGRQEEETKEEAFIAQCSPFWLLDVIELLHRQRQAQWAGIAAD